MAGINISGDNTSWNDDITIYSLDSSVLGNNVSTPDTDGDSNIPLRQLSNRTARIKELLDTFGIYVKNSEFRHSGQNVIYNAAIRGDVGDGNVVSYNTNQYWNLDLSQNDSRNAYVGIADKSNSRIITNGLVQLTKLSTLSLTTGDPVYADPTTPGDIQKEYSSVQVGKYLFDNVMVITQVNQSAIVVCGSIIQIPFSTIPTGYLECNGAEISRTTYKNLFSVIGETYGNGDGGTTFNIPDYRGYFLRGHDNGALNDSDSSLRLDRGDGTTGDNVGTRQIDQFKEHSHQAPTAQELSPNPAGTYEVPNAVDQYLTYDYVNAAPTEVTGGSETRPKNIYVKFCIKY